MPLPAAHALNLTIDPPLQSLLVLLWAGDCSEHRASQAETPALFSEAVSWGSLLRPASASFMADSALQVVMADDEEPTEQALRNVQATLAAARATGSEIPQGGGTATASALSAAARIQPNLSLKAERPMFVPTTPETADERRRRRGHPTAHSAASGLEGNEHQVWWLRMFYPLGIVGKEAQRYSSGCGYEGTAALGRLQMGDDCASPSSCGCRV